MKKVLGIIPARLKSTRLPEKMLLPIAGRPLLYYTWRQAKKARRLNELIVATDSAEIYRAVAAWGGKALMTSSDCRSGSDRVAEAARKFKEFRPEIIINVQGDEPLISPKAINSVVDVLLSDRKTPAATVAFPIKEKKALPDRHLVKVVLDKNKDALYFSRQPLPGAFGHLGLYGFRKDFLKTFVALKQTPLEITEQLEQLRILENGYKIKVVVGNFQSIGVDTWADFKKAKKIIENDDRY